MDLRGGGPEAVETFLFARPVQEEWWLGYDPYLAPSDADVSYSDASGTEADPGPVWVWFTPRQACLGLERILSSMPRLVAQHGEDRVIQGFAALADPWMLDLAVWWLDWTPPEPDSPDRATLADALAVVAALRRFYDDTQGSPLAECVEGWLDEAGPTIQRGAPPLWHAFDRLLVEMLESGLMPRAAHAWDMLARLHGSSGRGRPTRPADARAHAVRKRILGGSLME